MAFWDASLAKPYSNLFYDYPSEDARVDADAARRAREFGAQSAAARGSRSPRGPALNTYNRLMSDYTTSKAQNERQNRLQYTNTMNALMRSPGAVTPSTASTLASVGGTVGGAILKEAAPDIWKRLKGNWWDSSPQQLSDQYNNLASPVGGSLGPEFAGEHAASGAGYDMLPAYTSLMDYGTPAADWSYGATDGFPAGGDWSYGVTDVMPYASDAVANIPDFSEAYQSIPDWGW